MQRLPGESVRCHVRSPNPAKTLRCDDSPRQPLGVGPVVLDRSLDTTAPAGSAASREASTRSRCPVEFRADLDWCLNCVEAGEGIVETRGGRTAVANPRIVSVDEALPLMPAILRPGLRLLGLAGFLGVERRVVAHAAAKRRRRTPRRRRR